MSSFLATSFLPSTVVVELTYACNNACLFCSCPWEFPGSNYKKGNEQSLEEWKANFDILLQNGVNTFSFTGGEPTLYHHYQDLISYLHKQKAQFVDEHNNVTENTPRIFLISNAQLLDENALLFFKEKDVNLSVSLPGLKTYNYHTQNGTAETVLNVIRKAKDFGLLLTLNVTVTKKNIDELYETISNGIIYGANNLLLNRFLPGGRGMNYRDVLELSKEETMYMIKVADSALIDANRDGNVGTEIPYCITQNYNTQRLVVGTRCSAAIDFFVVGPEGYIRVCNHSQVQLHHVNEIEKLKYNEYWKTFTQKDYLPQTCIKCNFTNICDGGCRESAHIITKNVRGCDCVLQ